MNMETWMNRRRSDNVLTPQKLLNDVCMAPLDWPGKMISLERSSTDEYRHRSFLPNISTAELYHENSKLYPEMLNSLTATQLNPFEFRSEFMRRRSAAVRNAGTSTLRLEPGCRELLSQVAKTKADSAHIEA